MSDLTMKSVFHISQKNKTKETKKNPKDIFFDHSLEPSVSTCIFFEKC